MLLYITIPGILLIVMFVFVPLLNGGRIAFSHGTATVKT